MSATTNYLTILETQLPCGRLIVKLGGELDMNHVPTLASRILTELTSDCRLTLDLRDLEYIDSAALSVLARAAKVRTDPATFSILVRAHTQPARSLGLSRIAAPHVISEF